MDLQLFFDNFDVIAAAPNGVKKLRELILQLAVRGKLVPQAPADEPAGKLLARIREEHEVAAKQKIAKPPKKMLPVAAEEYLYHKPASWTWCRIGDILQISSGGFLPSSKMVQDGKVPVYGGNGITGYHDQPNVNEPTLVIGRVGYYCGSIHITPESAWITDNAFITRFSKNNLDIEFLYWLLKSTDLQQNNGATAQPVISGSKVYPLVLALPPLEEQKRIVAKVNQLMTLCDTLQAHLTQRQTSAIDLAEVAVRQVLDRE
jgi:type I restriction enzyme, S subunit